ncbi:phage tail protein [Mucilaginibacter sp. E4BP6]|jgi:microcystin-dependent protein|uniref:phage tail protein n=1 Tax=Mucilaginibacter sp. E4BP6 TaxID=2723089 RepID=UPI0015C8CABA|nr:tail fiber protein [Mucilaginibacter sp. E4BP6]NYE65518.1 microcystin-dependent protein [Mucilaginibacter sp. E4BP6]
MFPSIGEIRAFAGSFAPAGWQLCNGQLLQIASNTTLYALIGTTYGGDGITTFGLPDLRGRLIVNQGQRPGLTNRVIGQAAGVESVTLVTANLPSHNHTTVVSTNAANTNVPTNNYLAAPVDTTTPVDTMLLYLPTTFSPITVVPLDPTTVGPTGGGQSHENRMPYLTINYIIALVGVFPSRN